MDCLLFLKTIVVSFLNLSFGWIIVNSLPISVEKVGLFVEKDGYPVNDVDFGEMSFACPLSKIA